jgi:hypothetical protein
MSHILVPGRHYLEGDPRGKVKRIARRPSMLGQRTTKHLDKVRNGKDFVIDLAPPQSGMDLAIAASAAQICIARTWSVCRGTRGSHLVAKYASTGTCPAMISCQICAIAPSSGSRTTTPAATPPKSRVSAATDINIGIQALGLLISKRIESGYWFIGTQIRPTQPCDDPVNLSVHTL